jgi:hypothetical protein
VLKHNCSKFEKNGRVFKGRAGEGKKKLHTIHAIFLPQISTSLSNPPTFPDPSLLPEGAKTEKALTHWMKKNI